MTDIFTEDFSTAPYWWRQTPPPDIDPTPLPHKVDVAIVGSGYTGLHTALQTARGGRSTLVFDAQNAGWGCSSRNGGQISVGIKPSYAQLARRLGPDAARAIHQEGRNALRWLGEHIASEGIDCGFEMAGRFHAAHNKAAFRRLVASLASEPAGLESGAEVVTRSEQRRELGTDAYFGGLVYPGCGALDPARYHRGLLDRALSAGAAVMPNTPVTAIERAASGFRLTCPRGVVEARDVMIATNGYTGGLTPWLRRRIVPIGSYMIATEPLDPARVEQMFPARRVVTDTRKVVYYYRLSPDRRRVLFGGRVSHGETDPRVSAPLLRQELTRLFPQLGAVRVSHSWMGFVGYTFDNLPHVGQRDGLHHAMGYCGTGIALAGYLGMRAGQKILGRGEGRTAFDGLTFQTRPLYFGSPWFLSAAVSYYRWRDNLNV